jgi:hypothetical protein
MKLIRQFLQVHDVLPRGSPCAVVGVILLITCWLSARVTPRKPLVLNGNINHTSTRDRERLDEWTSELFLRTMTSYHQTEREFASAVEPSGSSRFDLFSPFLKCPNGQPPTRFGQTGDGGKLICADMLEAPDCAVYSLGSRNDYSFENDVLSRTNCTVVTFDCTVIGHSTHARHTFVKRCIGSPERMEENPSDWITLSAAMLHMGHRRLDLLKIDIEGGEYDVIGAWRRDETDLPRQFAMELHYKDVYYGTPAFKNASDHSNLIWPLHEMRLSDLALFVFHIVNAGYGIVSREDNEIAQHCTELTFVRVLV